jgi:Ca-activated chloride channel homolog
MKKFILFALMILFVLTAARAQNERKFIRSGNKYFMEAVKDTTRLDTATFSKAETEYRKALNKKPGNNKWDFNLADALYKQMRFDEAEQKFGNLSDELETPEEKARSLHNLGNSQLMQKKIDESIETYKEALRKNPDDLDTKYNLAYAQMLKQQQQQQQQQNQQNKDQQNDQNDQNQDQQNQNKDQDQQNKNDQQDQQQQNQQNQQNQQDQQQQQQQPQNKISKQDAEQLLQALQNDERDIQEKVKKEKAARARKMRVEKEW